MIDIGLSRGPVSMLRTAAMGIQIMRLAANSVAKDIPTRSTRTLTSTSRANSMSRLERRMTTCGEKEIELDLVHNTCFIGLRREWI